MRDYFSERARSGYFSRVKTQQGLPRKADSNRGCLVAVWSAGRSCALCGRIGLRR